MSGFLKNTVTVFTILLILFIVLSFFVVSGLLSGELPFIGIVGADWSFASDMTSATLGIAVAVSGAFVAIKIAQETSNLAERTYKREVQEHVKDRMKTDLRSIKALRAATENIVFKAEIANNLVENSELIAMLENSVEIDRESMPDNIKLLKSDYSLNYMAINNFFYHAEEGKDLRERLTSLLHEISNSIIDVCEHIDSLVDSTPVIEVWKERLFKYSGNTNNSATNKTVESLFKFYFPRRHNAKELSNADIVELFSTLSLILRKNAMRLKYNIESSVDEKDVLLPFLDALNKTYKHKLLQYSEITESKTELNLILQSIDILPISGLVAKEYDRATHKETATGIQILALLHSSSRMFYKNNKSESEAKRFVLQYIEENKDLLKYKESVDTLCKTIDLQINKSESHLDKVMHYIITEFAEQIPQSLFESKPTDSIINKSIFYQYELQHNPDARLVVMKKTIDFFDSYPVIIEESKVSGKTLSDNDCFEPLYIYWLNRNNPSFERFEKLDNSLLQFVYRSGDQSDYEFQHKDVEHIESLLYLFHETYWDSKNGVLDLTDLVRRARARVMKFESDGDNIPITELEGLIRIKE